jgi:hypothetical protein
LNGAVFTNSIRLIGFIKSLKVEDIEAPVKGCTNAAFEEGFSVLCTSNGCIFVV